jgi:tetratricopeptide (TPR) repeat protein
MSYQEGEQTRVRRQSSKHAVSLAMEGRWKEAVAANQSLIENFPNDVDAYNRLGRAYMELGEYALSREAYEKTIELDPYNTIAKRNLQRLSHLNEAIVGFETGFRRVEPQHFIEEVGKAGVVSLIQLASPQVLARTVDGSMVNLKVTGSGLVAENNFGEYLGQVEQRHGQRLIKLMEGGNRYSAAVVSSAESAVTIIIKEVYQDPSQVGRLSFPPRDTEAARPHIADRIDDRIIRRQIEDDESLPEESGYAIVGGEGIEVLAEDSSDDDSEPDSEE